jgi:hypothetical protein
MKPAVKYALGRLGLFLVVFAVLIPTTPLNILVQAMVALIAASGLSLILLRRWRNESAEQFGEIAARRAVEKARLRSALAGDDVAAAEGDRVTAADIVEHAKRET